MKLHHLLVVGAAIFLLTACAQPPETYSIVNKRSYAQSYDKVWENIIGYLAQNKMQIKSIAKDSGIIYAEAEKFDDSVADCGSRGITSLVGRHATFNIFVNRSGKDLVVSVNTEFKETISFENVINTRVCNSKGVFEGNVLSAAEAS